MKNTSQGLKLAKYIAKQFVISEDKAYGFIEKAPLTIFDNIDKKKLEEVVEVLKNLDADFEVLNLGNSKIKL